MLKYKALIATLLVAACAVETEDEDPTIENPEGKADVFSIGTDGETIGVDGYLELPIELEWNTDQFWDSEHFTCGGWGGLDDCDLIVELIVPFEDRQLDNLREFYIIPEYPPLTPNINFTVELASVTFHVPTTMPISYTLSAVYDDEADDGSYSFAWYRQYTAWEDREMIQRDETFDSRVEDYIDDLFAGDTTIRFALLERTPPLNLIVRVAWH